MDPPAGCQLAAKPPTASVDVVEKLRRPKAERARELDYGAQSGFASRAFEQRDLGPVQVASIAERLLRETGREPRST